ncbi:MAG: PepSY domain-containing protein [Pseudomonadales bacterium]
MARTAWQMARVYLLRWHRRMGVTLAVCLLWLAATGILLNHTDDLSLDSSPVGISALQRWYLGDLPEIRSYAIGSNWLSAANGHVFFNGIATESCTNRLQGAVVSGEYIVAACDDVLLLIADDGALIERVNSMYGLPTPVSAIASEETNVVIRSGDLIYQVDLEELSFQRLPADTAPVWVTSSPAPPKLVDKIEKSMMGEGISWERFLLDLHSGRLFGRSGILLADIFALGLAMLALSGVWVWSTKPGRWRKRKQDA